MQIQYNEAIILEISRKSFKGKDGKEVNYIQARFIADDNQYHEATVDQNIVLDDDLDEYTRAERAITLDVNEVNRNGNTTLKKKVIAID
jgi:hypothetical protein